MKLEFQEGYEYFEKSAGIIKGAFDGGILGNERTQYIDSIKSAIDLLENDINSFEGNQVPYKILKGDVAEFWHGGTFNVAAAINKSPNQARINRSNAFGSVDISSNFGKDFGLKYYANGEKSAGAQSISVFQRFMEYRNKGGKDSLEKYLTDRGYNNMDNVLNDPIYSGQVRIIPHDQLEEAISWLERIIKTEESRRPEQAGRYQETLSLLSDVLHDNEGNKSIPLSNKDAEKLAKLAKDGKFKATDFGINSPGVLPFNILIKESLSAGMNAAIISIVLRIGPEIYKSIDYLIKNSMIEEEQLKDIGSKTIESGAESFIRGSVAAAISASCKSGIFGETLRNINAGVIGAITVITMNTLGNTYQVAIGNKTHTEITNELIKDLFIITSSMAGGHVGQSIMIQLPIIGYLLGSFIGSIMGSFAYSTIYKTAISFCMNSGITLFRLVEQNYKLPDHIIEFMGLDTFDYEILELDFFEPETFDYETFSFDSIQPDSLDINFLRRGVIGISKIGYI